MYTLLQDARGRFGTQDEAQNELRTWQRCCAAVPPRPSPTCLHILWLVHRCEHKIYGDLTCALLLLLCSRIYVVRTII